MSHEIFTIERKNELNEREKSRAAYLRDKLSSAERLGLNAQVRAIKVELATLERDGLITTPPMTDTEITIWRAYLPTVYGAAQFADYRFDRIPGDVLKVWEKHKASGAFEYFEIWTPENPAEIDPILVGVNGSSRHPLARWGESDANLISFDGVKRELRRRWYSDENIGGEGGNERWRRLERTVDSGMGAVVAFCAMLFLFPFTANSLLGFTCTMIAAVAVSAVAFFCVLHWKTRRMLRSSTLMQAIAKDDSRRRESLTAPA